MAEVQRTVDLIGDSALCDIILSREVAEGLPTDLYDDTVKYLKMQSLYGVTGLRSLTFTKLESIGSESIERCPDLQRVEVPVATTISSSGIRDNPLLEEVIAPMVTSIGSYAFSSDYSLKSAIFPHLTYLDQGAFYGCGGVTKAEFPRLQTLGNYAIAAMIHLKELDLPWVRYIGSDVLYEDSEISVINIGPYVTTISSLAFEYAKEGLVINLAVSEGDVEGAPWGATAATINYDVPYSGNVPMPEEEEA